MIAFMFFVFPTNIFLNENVVSAQVAEETPTKEDTGNKVAGFLAWVTIGLSYGIGKMLGLVIGALNILFAQQDFETEGVKNGWIIVRDLCNMFFILVLLMISFATILRLENYSMKKC